MQDIPTHHHAAVVDQSVLISNKQVANLETQTQ